MKVGYARVSTTHQNYDSQIQRLKAYGCAKIFSEKASATGIEARPELMNVIEFVREGDGLVITKLDRFARSVQDLYKMVEQLNSKNVVLKALDQQFDISSISGKLMLGILGLVAEFENDIRRARQMEGIRKAQAEGRYKTGREKSIDRDKVLELLDQELSQK